MRTLKELQQYFKDNKMANPNDGDGYNAENSFSWHIGGRQVTRTGWYSYTEWEGGEEYAVNINQSTYCCGVFEMGHFEGAHRNPEHWEAILEYILRKQKLSYLRTETITKNKVNAALEKALVKVGFRLVTTIPSGHAKREGARRIYKIKVWEWLKK